MANRLAGGQEGQPQAEAEYKWWALLVASFGLFVVTQDAGIISLSLPALATYFDTSTATVAWVSVSFLITSTALMPVVGRLGDAYSHRAIFTWGFVIFGVGTALCAFALSLPQLFLFRLIQGAGGAMVLAIGRAIVTSAFPPSERGKAMGFVAVGVSLGLASGPLLGGSLVDILGWRSVFYARIPIALVGAVLSYLVVKDVTAQKKEFRLDWWGAALLVISLTCLLIAVNRSPQPPDFQFSILFISTAIGCLVTFPLFIVIEWRVAQPVIDLRLFRYPFFGAGNLNLMVVFMMVAALNLAVPFFLIRGLGFSATKAGAVLAAAPLARIFTSALAGWLSDEVGPRLPMAVGLVVMTLGLVLLSSSGQESPLPLVILWLVFNGLGQGLWEPPNSSAVMGAVPRERLGTGSAIYGTTLQVGISVGFALFGAVLNGRRNYYAGVLATQGVGGSQLASQAITGGFQDAILVSALFTALGFIVVVAVLPLWLRREKRKAEAVATETGSSRS